jgi:hypothetical protein
MVGVRFWKLKDAKDKKPMNVELFEIEGITEYIVEDDALKQVPGTKQIKYKNTIYTDKLTTEVINQEVYEVLPIFPLYANELKQSEFTDGLKGKLDAWDFITSDLSDGITQIEGIYWAIKNFGGNDAKELIEEIEQWRATVNKEDAEAKNFAVEIPYKAKEYALKVLRDAIYEDTMALDIKAITGGSLTNVAINIAKTDFDLKTDIFEWQAADFVQNILSLLGAPDVEIKFARRSNDNQYFHHAIGRLRRRRMGD